MPMAEWRPPDQAERERIVDDLDTSILVEAGAGSGKTTAMVARMVALVRTGRAEVEQIVGVTFTRKAAAELRERFQDALERAFRAAGSEPGERARLRAALDRLDACFIGTIHAFCARLLRERPLDAGVEPGFGEVFGAQEEALRRDAWNRYLERLTTRPARRNGVEVRGSRLLAQLSAVGLAPRQLFGLYSQMAEDSDVIFPTRPEPPPSDSALQHAREYLEALMEQSAPLLPRDEPDGGWDELQRKIRSLGFSSREVGWDNRLELYNALSEAVFANNTQILRKWGPRREDKEQAKDIAQRWSALSEFPNPVRDALNQWLAHRYPAAIRFARAAAAYYERDRMRTGMLTFQDLLRLTARMLRSRESARRELGAKYRYLLVDEFQDTDPLQAEIVFRLSARSGIGEDWRTLVPTPGALFVVGDPKQSIYRFRRADIALYVQVKQQFERFGAVLQLTANFRSTGRIERFVNSVFAERFPDAVPEDGSQAAFAPMLTDPSRAEDGRVASYLFDARDGRGKVTGTRVWQPDSERVASWIRNRIDSDGREPSDFLILTRTRPPLATYARALERHNIPFQVSGAGIGVEQELEELIRLLEALSDPNNPVLTLAVLEGLFFGLDHDTLYQHARTGATFNFMSWQQSGTAVDEALHTLRGFWERTRTESADVCVPAIVEQLGILPYAAAGDLGSTRAGALLYALDVLRQGALAGRTSLPDAIDLLRSAVTEEADAEAPLMPGATNAVRLMNLHRAKGLEAPTVILANPSVFEERARDRIVRRDSDGPARGWVNVLDSSRRDRRPVARPIDWDDHVEAERAYSLAEEDRLLYVAATRAAHELIVARCAQSPNAVWKWLHTHLDHPELADPIGMQLAGHPRRVDLETPVEDIVASIARATRTRGELARPAYNAASVRVRTKPPAPPIPGRGRKSRAQQLGLALNAPDGADDFGHDRNGNPIVQPTLFADHAPQPHQSPPTADRPREILDTASDESRGEGWGRAVHEALDAAARGATGEALRKACREALLAAECPLDENAQPVWLADLFAIVQKMVDSELFARARRARRMLPEVAFVARFEPEEWLEVTRLPEIVEGRIDLAFEEEDGWVIADYKTDVLAGRALRERKEQYRRQVELYARCWEKISGTRVKEKRIVFTAMPDEELVF